MAVEYGTNFEEAAALSKRIAHDLSGIPLYLSQINPVIGTHTDPEALRVSVIASPDSSADTQK